MAAQLSSWGGWGCSQRRECLLEVGEEPGHQVGENVPDCGAHLEDVVPRLHISYVNPLAVDVCVVGVIAAWTQALGKGMKGEAASQSHPTPIQGIWGSCLCASSLTWAYSRSGPR